MSNNLIKRNNQQHENVYLKELELNITSDKMENNREKLPLKEPNFCLRVLNMATAV